MPGAMHGHRPAARHVVTASGGLPYDSLVIATGSLMRELPQCAAWHAARALPAHREQMPERCKAGLRECKHLVVIGGGLIGLEVAASAAELGVRTTVIEVAPRIMARVCDEETGACHRRKAPATRASISAPVTTGHAVQRERQTGFE